LFNEKYLPKLAEELIDAIFYILDAYGMMYRDLGIPSPDVVFIEKLERNMKRGIISNLLLAEQCNLQEG